MLTGTNPEVLLMMITELERELKEVQPDSYELSEKLKDARRRTRLIKKEIKLYAQRAQRAATKRWATAEELRKWLGWVIELGARIFTRPG